MDRNDVFDFIKQTVGKELVGSYIESLAITENLVHTGYFITTGDLERLFYDALNDNYTRGMHYDLIQSEKIGAGISPIEKINIDQETRCITVNGLACNGVYYRENKGAASVSCFFKYLIAADGAKRSVVKSLGNNIFFSTTQEPLSHPKHTVVTFQIPQGTTPKECYEKRVRPGEKGAETLNPCPLEQLSDKYGWDAPSRPYSQVLATGDIVYIGTE